MTLPAALRDYLSAPSLYGVWQRIRDRLERTGHALTGSVCIDLDPDAADRLSGLLGRHVQPGTRHLPLGDLDEALLGSKAAMGLVSVVAELTGGPVRDRPSERRARDATITQLFAHVEETISVLGLATYRWAHEWISWLHTSGLLVRAGSARAVAEFDIAAKALAVLPDGRDRRSRMLGELASEVAGDAHALDSDRLAGRLAVRALTLASGSPEPTTPRERMLLWESFGIAVDTISGTVITWALRPPGDDSWSTMMRARADQGFVTHLTIRELLVAPDALVPSGVMVSACENPQVLQRIADAAVDRPVVCFSGNPSLAGHMLADRVRLRYHGDFDWPGIAIAARLIAAGARPWRLDAQDYLDAIYRGGAGIELAGTPVPTPWDPPLESTMTRVGQAIHEESLVERLIADLRGQ